MSVISNLLDKILFNNKKIDDLENRVKKLEAETFILAKGLADLARLNLNLGKQIDSLIENLNKQNLRKNAFKIKNQEEYEN